MFSLYLWGGLVVVSVVLGLLARKIWKKDDSKAEEIAEDVLRSQTGINVDFSPKTPEK